MDSTERPTRVPLAIVILLTSVPDLVQIGSESGMTSSSAACVLLKLSSINRVTETYHACERCDWWVEAEDFVDDGVEVGKVTCELIVRRVCAILEKLISQFCLSIRVPR